MTNQPSDGNRLRDALNRAIEERRQLRAELHRFDVDDAISHAGFGQDHPFRQVIVDTYDGDADPDGIRTFAATTFGIGTPPDDHDIEDDR